VLVQDTQDGGSALIEWAVRTVRLQIVVFDEIDAGFGEDFDLRRGLLRRHAHAGLDDGADQRPPKDSREAARSCNAELRTLIGGEESRRQRHVQQLEP